MVKKTSSLWGSVGNTIYAVITVAVVCAWYDTTFNPDMTYMCRFYIGEHPIGGDAYLDSATLDNVMACRLDQRRYRQTFRPIRSCTEGDIEHVRTHPNNNRTYCLVR